MTDPAGNDWSYEYDVLGRQDASFVYTPDGDRLVRREGGVATVHLPGGQEIFRVDATGAVRPVLSSARACSSAPTRSAGCPAPPGSSPG